MEKHFIKAIAFDQLSAHVQKYSSYTNHNYYRMPKFWALSVQKHNLFKTEKFRRYSWRKHDLTISIITHITYDYQSYVQVLIDVKMILIRWV